MTIYRVARLSIETEDLTGRVDKILSRPGGFALPLREAPQLSDPFEQPVESTGDHEEGTLNLPHGKIGPDRLFVLETSWKKRSHPYLLRRFRTLATAVVERVELLDIEYRFFPSEDPQSVRTVPLLEFDQPLDYRSADTKMWISTPRYNLVSSLESEGEVRVLPPVDEASALRVGAVVRGPGRIKLAIAIVSSEHRFFDPVTYILAAPLDDFTFTLVAVAPALLRAPVSGPARQSVQIPSPAMIYLGPIPERDGWSMFLRRLFSMKIRGGSVPATDFPLGDLLRMSNLAIYRHDSALGNPLWDLVKYLKSLRRDRLASLQTVLLLAHDADDYQQLEKWITEIGEVSLARSQSSMPKQVLLRAVLTDGSRADRLTQALTEIESARADLRSSLSPFEKGEAWSLSALTSDLPPVYLPETTDPLTLAPLLVAARLRERVTISEGSGGHVYGWLKALDAAPQTAQAAAVGRFVLADLHTRERLWEGTSNSSYERLWRDELLAIESGERKADRIIFAVVAGKKDEFDRMKLLPAILLSGDVPCPILPLRVSQRHQRALIRAWADCTAAAARLYMQGAESQGSEKRRVSNLEKTLTRFRKRVKSLIPAEYIRFLKDVKPKEVFNLSWLPLDWMELDGIPLGFLTKISSIRSETLNADCGFCGDLAATYSGFVASHLRPSQTPFKVLIIAPQYKDSRQDAVNEYIASRAGIIQKYFEEKGNEGREVALEVADGKRHTLLTLLRQTWTLVVYLGHAREGELVLPHRAKLGPLDLPRHTFLGATVILIGCDTLGARSLSGSIANQFVKLGAKGVFSTTYPLPLILAEDLDFHLLAHLFRSNARFGDVMALLRLGILMDHSMMFLGRAIGHAPKPGLKLVGPAEASYEEYRDGWDRGYRKTVEFYGSALGATLSNEQSKDRAWRLAEHARLGGLAVTFAGDLRARLFDF